MQKIGDAIAIAEVCITELWFSDDVGLQMRTARKEIQTTLGHHYNQDVWDHVFARTTNEDDRAWQSGAIQRLIELETAMCGDQVLTVALKPSLS